MFTTVESVLQNTGFEVDLTLLNQAQNIIEVVLGRPEVEVTNASDRALAGKAVEFQAAYMKENYETVFTQMAVRTIAQSDGTIVLDVDLLAPFVAPMAVIALRNLSWRRSRSVHTGPNAKRRVLVPWERD